jgi:hypothetical protein
MQTLSTGVFKPANGDTGDLFFPAMASNCDWMNNHTHNGTNSQPLASLTQTVLAANWTLAPIGGGVYMQTLTVPAGFSYDQCQIWFKLSSNQYVYPSIERASATTFNVFINDNSLSLIANYR